MALIAAISAFLGRAVGRILQTTLGWASVLLFGRVPPSRQIVMAAITLGSIAWIAALVGVAVPGAGVFLLTAIPRVPYVQDWMLRLVMLVAALVIPLLIGAAGLLLVDRERRPNGLRIGIAVLRGYPFAFVLAFTLVFLSVVAVVTKMRSLAKRWKDDHVPIVVKPGAYGAVADDLEAALREAGLDVSRRRAPRVLEVPSHLLARVAGRGVRSLVPDQLVMLEVPGLEVLLYPSDIAISGENRLLAAARAALAARLTSTDAHLTTSTAAQDVEDELQRISIQTMGTAAPPGSGARGRNAATASMPRSGGAGGARGPGSSGTAGARGPATAGIAGTGSGRAGTVGGRGSAPGVPSHRAAGTITAARSMAAATPNAARRTPDPGPEAAFRDIDRRLSSEDFPQQDWEVLYRMRLQVERDLLTARAEGATAGPSTAPGNDAAAAPPGTTAATTRRADRSRVMGLAAAVTIGLAALDVALAIVEYTADGRAGGRR